MTTVSNYPTESSRHGLATWPPRTSSTYRNRTRRYYAAMAQTIANIHDSEKQAPRGKRKRPTFDDGFESDSEFEVDESQKDESVTYTPGRRHAKRPCQLNNETKETSSAAGGAGNLPEPSGSLKGTTMSGKYQDKPLFGSDDELMIEHARSPEPCQNLDMDPESVYDTNDVSPAPDPDDDLSERSSVCSDSHYDDEPEGNTAFCDRPDVQQYIQDLPNILTRRHRNEVLSQRNPNRGVDDETLRVELLSRLFEVWVNAGEFTDDQVQEIISQRPIDGSYGELEIPTPHLSSEFEADEELNSYEWSDIDFDDSLFPGRPSRPLLDDGDDSSSEPDSDTSGEPASPSAYFTQWEMETMGIYQGVNGDDLEADEQQVDEQTDPEDEEQMDEQTSSEDEQQTDEQTDEQTDPEDEQQTGEQQTDEQQIDITEIDPDTGEA